MASQVTSFPELTSAERNALTSVPTGTIILNTDTAQFELWNGTIWIPQTGINFSGGSFANYFSNPINTDSTAITSTSWETFDNSPAFTFTPSISGVYKVYSNVSASAAGSELSSIYRIFNTSGGATLLAESQGSVQVSSTVMLASILVESIYSLVAGTTYVFDIQGQVASGGSAVIYAGNGQPFPTFYMFAEGIGLQGTINTTGSSFNIFTSNIVNTISGAVSSVVPTFTTFDNSPAFTFTPNITGTYKVYASVPLETNSSSQEAICQIINTSGGATLLSQSQGVSYSDSPATVNSATAQNTYLLTGGVTYTFDIQGAVTGSGPNAYIRGDVASFYMYAEGIGLNNNSSQFPVAFKAFSGGNFGASGQIVLPSPTITFDTNTAYNPSTGIYTAPYAGFYVVGFSGQPYAGGQIAYIEVDGVFQGYLTDSSGANGDIWATSTLVKCNAGSQIAWWNEGSTDFNGNTHIYVYSQQLNQGLIGPKGSSSGSAFAFFASTVINTESAANPATSYATFSNSPAFTFTPTISGIYKVYCSMPLECDSGNQGQARIYNTSGGATLLQESDAQAYVASGGAIVDQVFAQSTYVLNAGTTYVFDIQGQTASGNTYLRGDGTPFYVFAEGISLSPVLASPVGVVTTQFGIAPSGPGSLTATANSPIIFPYTYFDTTSSYNATSGEYTAPVAGYYDVNLVSFYFGGNQADIFICVNGINVAGRLIQNNPSTGVISGGAQVYLNYGDVLTLVPDNTYAFVYSGLTQPPSIGGYIPTVTISLRPPTPAVTSRIVKSLSTGAFAFSNSLVEVLDSGGVNPVSATVNTNGNDVEVGFQSDGTDQSDNSGVIFTDSSPTVSYCTVYFYRDGTMVGAHSMYMQNNISVEIHGIPISSFRFIDSPPPGSHTYTAYVIGGANRADQGIYYSVLYARPLA